MISLSNLNNAMRPRRQSKRLGRGVGSGKGVRCGRGQKGAGARSGYKRRFGKEGGNLPQHMKLPERGFERGFKVIKIDSINLWQIDQIFEDGELVSIETLFAKGFLGSDTCGVKILSTGELTKKVKIEAQAFSDATRAKLEQLNIEFTVV
jgi:large subunit ribosomal protein L15